MHSHFRRSLFVLGLFSLAASAHAQISFPSFPSSSFGTGANQITLNGDASSKGSVLGLTNAGDGFTGGSAFYNTKQDTAGGFYTDFRYNLSGGDGLTFLLNNNAAGTTALGGIGGYLGYMSLPNTLAVEFDNFDNGGGDVVGVTVRDGTEPPFGGGFGSAGTIVGGTHDVRVLYGGSTLSVFLDNLSAPILSIQNLNLSNYTDANGFTYVGFTAGEASQQGDQSILNWNFALGAPLVSAVPEPGAIALLGSLGVGGTGLLLRQRVRR